MRDTIDLRIPGISRMADNEKALLLSCNRKPTDEEMIVIHDRLCARPALLNVLKRLAHVAELLGADRDDGGALAQARAAISETERKL